MTQDNSYYQSIKQKADTSMQLLLISNFLLGLFLATFYDTWFVGIGVGGICLSAFFLSKIALPKSTLYQYVAAIVLAVFVAQYIYQMHGLFEMHFFAFIFSTFLISYQKWILQIPFILTVSLHHATFAYAQFAGKPNVYFTQLDYMDAQTFAFHMTLATVVVVVSGYWSYSFDKRNKRDSEQKDRISQLYNDSIQNKRKMQESINYAQKIQNLILPKIEGIRAYLPSAMLLYKPKDIVSGDIFWFTQKGHINLIGAIDCTGHGVPGAFMSILATEKLNEIVHTRGIVEPAKILELLDDSIQHTLKQRESGNRDGMTISLCSIDRKNKSLQFAGAKSSLVITEQDYVREIKGDKNPIGRWVSDGVSQFTQHDITLEKGQYFYMFSDGYQDQFGGPDNKKFGKNKLLNLIGQLSENMYTPSEQRMLFEDTFNEWKGEKSQIDDILIIGFSSNDILAISSSQLPKSADMVL
ncbi:SpoIIE family protein phosphatase [Limibacter armeniacum]|uniref:PP2C family protein-serine/threonine phosphatase n=1 Tax=Limibacter armeniacum TaxID=466084 RepID=UPI002FE5E036